MSNSQYKLVYSTDGSHKNVCQKCKEIRCICDSVVSVSPSEILVKIRLEKKGRGGKQVTVLFNLPHNPDYFTKLSKKLKNFCGSGGTYKDQTIEIQGDQRVKAKQFLEKQGFQVKLSGG